MKNDKRTKLFIILGSFFITNAIVAEFIGTKIFSFENSLNISKADISLFGMEHLSFELTCGVLLWPVVFVMTDIINEYYGKKGVKLLSYIAAGMIAYAFLMVLIAIKVSPASWWIESYKQKGVPNMQDAFAVIFGQGMWIIVASLIAFLIGQLIDVYVFHAIRKASGEKYLWLRSTGSTLVSQLIDSFVVLFVAFYIGGNWTLNQIFAVGTMNYIYKFAIALAITPLLYVLHHYIDKYLGKETAEKMIEAADHQYDEK
ncbi:MAG TPA: queuosine precursor transporter [Bacteroidia bacterium]